MLLLKIIHVIGNVLWLGGGTVAAFAIAMLSVDSPSVRLAAAKVARKLVLGLVTPGMLLSLAAGLAMLIADWSTLYAKAPWMHGKLTVGLIAAGFSGVLSGKLRRAASSTDGEVSAKSMWIAGSALLASAVANIIFVYLRFGAH